MQLSGNFVPPNEMHLVRWYLPLRPGPKWYYHSYVGTWDASTSTPIELVDPSLRPIIRRLNAAGYPTLASCEGHWMTEAEFTLLERQLRLDEHAIRSSGLVFYELQSGQTFTYCDADYHRPDEALLRQQIYDHQGLGFYSYVDGNQVVFVEVRNVR